MSAGRFRHLVTLEQRTQGADGSVGLSIGYTVVDEVWADIVAVRGSDYLASVQLGEASTHRITIRRRSMDDFNYLNYEGRRFRKQSVRDPDGRRRVLEVMAVELDAEVV